MLRYCGLQLLYFGALVTHVVLLLLLLQTRVSILDLLRLLLLLLLLLLDRFDVRR